MMTRTSIASRSRGVTLRRVLRSTLRVAALVALAPLAGFAQESPASPRWDAWLGCWQAATVDSVLASAPRAIVCVTQVERGTSVELATVVAGRISARDTLDASGEQRPITMQGCTGWRRGEWSRDGRRVFLRSEVSCGAGLTRLSTGVLGITNSGEWLDVQTASVAGNATVRAARYRALNTAATTELPLELVGAVRADELRLQMARTGAGTPVSTVEVIEAVQEVDTLAVQSWLIELGQSFDIDGRRIVELAQAGVPGSVTDVMIGVSFPERFELRSATPGGRSAPMTTPAQDSALIASRYYGSRACMAAWDPFWMPPTIFESAYYYDDPCSYRYGARGYGYRGSYYGFATYGYNSGYYGNYYGPVVVVRDDEPRHGKLVKGRGYTRGDTQSSGSGESTSLPAQRGTSESTKSSSGGSSGGSKSGGSSSTGRTAQKRGGS